MTFTANGKRQTAKMKLLPSPFSCVYSRVKLFVFAMNSRRRYSIFVCFTYGLEEKNSKSEVIFAVCRLPLTSCLTSLMINIDTAQRTLQSRVNGL